MFDNLNEKDRVKAKKGLYGILIAIALIYITILTFWVSGFCNIFILKAFLIATGILEIIGIIFMIVFSIYRICDAFDWEF